MEERELRFWTKWYNDDSRISKKNTSELQSVRFEVEVEHCGGYGYCDIEKGIDVSFRFVEGPRSWDWISIDEDEFVDLILAALNFERD